MVISDASTVSGLRTVVPRITCTMIRPSLQTIISLSIDYMSEELGVDSMQLELAMCQSWIRLAMFVFLRMFCMFQSSRMISCCLHNSQSKSGHQSFTKAIVQYRTVTLVFIVLLQMDYAGGFKRSSQK